MSYGTYLVESESGSSGALYLLSHRVELLTEYRFRMPRRMPLC